MKTNDLDYVSKFREQPAEFGEVDKFIKSGNATEAAVALQEVEKQIRERLLFGIAVRKLQIALVHKEIFRDAKPSPASRVSPEESQNTLNTLNAGVDKLLRDARRSLRKLARLTDKKEDIIPYVQPGRKSS